MTGDDDLAETMRARLQVDLRSAMKRRDALEVSTLRCLIGALDNAGAVDDPLSSRWATGLVEDVGTCLHRVA